MRFFVGFLVYYLLLWYFNPTISALKRFPGPSAWSIFKVLISQSGYTDFRQLCLSWTNVYGSRFRTVFSHHLPYLMLSDPEDIQVILTHPDMLDKGPTLKVYTPWFGTGLIVAPTEKWKILKKISAPFFANQNMRAVFPTIQKEVTSLCSQLISISSAGQSTPVDIKPMLSRFSYKMALLTTTGISRDILVDQFLNGAKTFSQTVSRRSFRPWYSIDFIWNNSAAGKKQAKAVQVLDSVFNQAIQESIENDAFGPMTDNNNGEKLLGKSYLRVLRERKANEGYDILDDEEILRNVLNVSAGASGTTGVNLSWIIFLLGQRLSDQKILQAEVDAALEELENDSSITLFDQLSKLKHIDAFIKETMRLFPTIDLIERYARKDVHLNDGAMVPAGALVGLLLGAASRDPKAFPDPDKFDMSRFLPDSTNKRHPYSYLPFSGGPRRCIGSQLGTIVMKTVLIEILKQFTIITESSLEEVGCNYYLGMHPKNSVKIQLAPRTQS